MYSHRKSLNFGQYIPNDKVLNKKVPENPKYKHVKPAIDTGKNVKRHIDELKEKQKNCHHKKDEVFNRVKFSTFIKLAITVAKEIFKQEEAGGCITRENVENTSETNKVDKSRLANVLMGIGEIDLRNEKKKQPVQPKIERKVPYLLLDVRDRDEFLQCHIKTARHYPAAMLSRSIGYEIEEMKHYKNNRPELIIVYDYDESIASRVATTLVQRGYENIYLLSGGLKLGYEIFPRSLMALVITGHSSSATLGPSFSKYCFIKFYFFNILHVENIEHYTEDIPPKGNYGGSCKTGISFSRSDKSIALGTRTGGSTEYSSKCRLITSRNDSACSSRSSEPLKSRATSRSFGDDRLRPIKKAPWK
ncbi:centrosomal protein of 41 kDa B [Nephila pilipes]|uniref:Centrosomal protein of 41 kDa B n=1 Tax=Nephila pilipes TaxID=299642 RepID=A0A8X6N372_NEPPI|nr:centrosomal protein of 41 kDa B [Nephila pilipes]